MDRMSAAAPILVPQAVTPRVQTEFSPAASAFEPRAVVSHDETAQNVPQAVSSQVQMVQNNFPGSYLSSQRPPV